jgi:hypothetical protein
MYVITPYTKRMAKQLGVEVKPSTRKNKKIDVYKDGQRIATIGDTRYTDFATLHTTNLQLAEEKRRLYHLRHTKKTIGEQMALKLLW